MALINRIGPGDFVADWRTPLSQYFRIVREFNALSEPFEKQVQLLTGFSELRESWRDTLQKAADSLVSRRRQQIQEASSRIADLMEAMLAASETLPLNGRDDQQGIDRGINRLESTLAAMEQDARRDVERIFNHADINREESALPGLSADLFSEQTWQLFSLSRDQVLAMGAVGGAATGALLDAGSGGLSLFLGTGMGAILGAAGAWLGTRQLIGTRILGMPLGGYQVIVGPVKNISFPWVVLGRAVTHLRLVCERSHALRQQLKVEHAEGKNPLNDLDAGHRRKMQSVFSRLSKGRGLSTAERHTLETTIADLLEVTATESGESSERQ